VQAVAIGGSSVRMIEILDTAPDVDVQPAEYKRLLGYPRDFVVADRAAELVDWARQWYADHGRPWVYAREIDSIEIAGETMTLNGQAFTSPRLSETLRAADSHCAIVWAGR